MPFAAALLFSFRREPVSDRHRHHTRDTIEKWISEIPEFEFDGNELHCKACDVCLKCIKKSTVKKHVKSERHRCRVSGNVTASERQRQFNLDLLKMMVGCN
ncbi:hypothetical protein K8353_43670, partial [Burkholderia contaminans]|nr:hypothetical protein [Burkholderia contaminans]